MPRLVINIKKKRPPTGELSRLKEQLRRLTEQLTSRDRELAEAAATGTNLQIGNGCHCPERRGIARCSRTPWCSASTARSSNVVAHFGSIRCGKFKRRTMKSSAPSPLAAP